LLATCLAVLALASCEAGSGGGGNNNFTQTLQMDRFDAGPDDLILNLRGPDSGSSVAITYFVFGSHVSLGNETDVPLFPDRLEEQAVATLAQGESMDNVDLSPWDAYEFVYLRAIPCEPQIIILLEKGNRYDFSST